MKKLFYILLAGALMAISCNKEIQDTKDVISSEKIDGLKVWATLPSEMRSHLGSDGLSLYWDADDELILWSTYLGTEDEMNTKTESINSEYGLDAKTASIGATLEMIHNHLDTQVGGVLSLSSGEGTARGSFHSGIPVEDWFTPGSGDDQFYMFMSMYPAPETVPFWNVYEQVLEQETYGLIKDYIVYQPYVKVNVPSVQDGKSYWKYQRLLDRGFEDRPGTVDEACGIVSRPEVVSGDYKLEFSEWDVMTSLLSFTMQSSDGNTYEIDHLDITFEYPMSSGDYRDNLFALSGNVPAFLLFDEPHESCLHSTFGKLGHGYVPQGNADAWSEMAEASTKLTLQFTSPVEIDGTPTSSADPFYAVVIPTMNLEQGAYNAGLKPRVCFRAYAPNGDLILSKKMAMGNTFYSEKYGVTVYPGFYKGTKYSLNLSLDRVTPPEEALSGQFSLSETTKAYIAHSNLWAYVSNGLRDQNQGANGWKLATNQYDMVGSAANYADFSNYTGWIDLFGFSTTKNDHGIPVFSAGTEVTDFSGDAAGWTDCMAASGWRTITADEGVYLFTERTNAMSLFAYATVYVGAGNNPVKGLVFLPDNWITPATCGFTPINQIGYNFNVNTYNAEGATTGSSGNWDDMESAGAVFWPAAGVRDGDAVETTHLDVGDYVGAYWSGSPDDNHSENGCLLLFGSTDFNPDGYPRNYGGCVRLVRDVLED